MIKEKFNQVKQILEMSRASRDDDRQLCLMFWNLELMEQGRSKEYFFEMYLDAKLSTAESITRTRRKIQEEIPTLRGDRYKERIEKLEPKERMMMRKTLLRGIQS